MVREHELTLKKRLKKWALKLKSDVIAMYFALKHPLTPLYAKIFTAIVVGYALSPIDLIPDFVPILGYLDDLIILPLGITIAIRLIPASVLDACREKARNNPPTMKPKIWVAAYFIILIWLIVIYSIYKWSIHTIPN